MRISVNLRGVATRCCKPGCKHVCATLHRHHRRSEKLFVNVFGWQDGAKYKRFVRRYNEFHEDDIVVICEWHHREIHELYRPIIDKAMWKCEKVLSEFSWKQAEILMNDLGKACDRWLKKKTPGSPPWQHT